MVMHNYISNGPQEIISKLHFYFFGQMPIFPNDIHNLLKMPAFVNRDKRRIGKPLKALANAFF